MKNKFLMGLVGCILIIGVTGCGQKEQKMENLLNNPKDTSVKTAIEKVEGVKSICLVTENNDPNGQLNKDGGYTGAVFFRLTQVDEIIAKEDGTPYGSDSCEVGTTGGGQIEIYANEKDAKKRNEYLATSDGTFLASFHSVRGTLVIRLSDDLTATQQKAIEEKIFNVLNEKK
ncbi:MAG: hypothetical protein RSG51_01930 [Bacilli bacterium]